MAFAQGKYAYRISDRSGFRYRIKDMKKEYLGYENNLKLLNDIKMQSTSIFKFLPERSLEAFKLYQSFFDK